MAQSHPSFNFQVRCAECAKGNIKGKLERSVGSVGTFSQNGENGEISCENGEKFCFIM
jgi:hypothetical protein